MGKTKVMACGVFDLLHVGHIDYLRNAREFGDMLIACVSTDECAARYGKNPVQPFAHRIEIVRALRFVDMVLPQHSREERQELIEALDIDIFVTSMRYMDDPLFDPHGCGVIYLPYRDDISTTMIKEKIQNGT
jgi:glycerol-3-phosphate cytidylyltransferase